MFLFLAFMNLHQAVPKHMLAKLGHAGCCLHCNPVPAIEVSANCYQSLNRVVSLRKVLRRISDTSPYALRLEVPLPRDRPLRKNGGPEAV